MSDTFGLSSRTLLAHWDPSSSCWKMSQATLLSEDQPLLEKLPNWGTMRNGELYERLTPELPTSVSDSSLLPTPVVNDMGAGKTVEHWDNWTEEMRSKHGNGNGHGKSLSIEAQRLLPTPTAQAAKHGASKDEGANAHGFNLWDVPHLLPTPTSRDHKGSNQRDDDSCLPGAMDRITGRVRQKKSTGESTN